MYCKKCGKQIPNGSEFCKYCGSKQNISVNEQTPVYIVNKPKKNKNYYELAKNTQKETLAVGILQTLSLIVNVVIFIILSTVPLSDTGVNAVVMCWSILICGLGVPAIIFIIKTLTKYKPLKMHTKMNALFVILSFAIAFGLDEILTAIWFMILLIYDANVLPLLVASWLSVIYLITVSFITSVRVGKTLHE